MHFRPPSDWFAVHRVCELRRMQCESLHVMVWEGSDICLAVWMGAVDKTLDEKVIDKLVEEGKSQEVLDSALISDDLRDCIGEIEQRHAVYTHPLLPLPTSPPPIFFII